MLVVRKEGKEHARYNSFRSAFELLESVGRDPQDCFDERHEDLPPLQKLQQRIDLLESVGRDPSNCLDEVLLQKMERMQQQIEQLQTSHQQQIEQLQTKQQTQQTKQQTQAQQIAKLMLENELLRSTVNDVLK